jgi:predicted RNase H-like nuclease (RuvC/YqgF family)
MGKGAACLTGAANVAQWSERLVLNQSKKPTLTMRKTSMKPLSANAAAKMAGKAKGTILTALKDGTLSGKQNAKGQWEIDPSELARAFDFRITDQSEDQSKKPTLTSQKVLETSSLEREVEALRKEIDTACLERERERSQLTNQIEDLRTRLDKESEERRALTAMITDQSRAGQGVKRGGFLGLFGTR